MSKFEDYKEYIESLLKAKAVPDYVKNPEIAFMMMEYGKARGFSPIDSIHFITPINGVMTTNAKGVGWLLNDAKYVFKEVERASYIYFGDGKEIKSQRPLDPDEVAWGLKIDPKDWSEYSPDKRKNIATFRDRVTTIEYGFRNFDGKVIWEGKHSYYWSDAVAAGLDTKETYKKYAPDMMLHRAKVGLSKILGILTGSESEELSHAINIGEVRVVDGEVEVIN